MNSYLNAFFNERWPASSTMIVWLLVSDCGISAHKHCKDQVIMECRSRSSVGCHCNGTKNGSANGIVLNHVFDLLQMYFV